MPRHALPDASYVFELVSLGILPPAHQPHLVPRRFWQRAQQSHFRGILSVYRPKTVVGALRAIRGSSVTAAGLDGTTRPHLNFIGRGIHGECSVPGHHTSR